MTISDVLVLGGPSVGKTHFAGQLLGRLRNSREGALRLIPGGADDLGKFEEVLGCLEEGRSAGHTSAKTWTGMKCDLETPAGDRFQIEWPDYGGERLMSIVDKRELTPAWRLSIRNSHAWLLFIRPSTLKLYEDILTRPLNANGMRSAAPKTRVDGSGWDDKPRYVEMLQILLFAAGRSTFEKIQNPKLAVLLSCWDELHTNQKPEDALREHLPLLHAFIESTWAEGFWTVWGLSSLGRELKSDSRDEEYVRKGPEKFGYVIHPGSKEQDPDLTAPVAWLLGDSAG